MFGVGGESLNMAVNTYTVTWFRDTDLNMVFGLQLSVSRLVPQIDPSVKLYNHGEGPYYKTFSWLKLALLHLRH